MRGSRHGGDIHDSRDHGAWFRGSAQTIPAWVLLGIESRSTPTMLPVGRTTFLCAPYVCYSAGGGQSGPPVRTGWAGRQHLQCVGSCLLDPYFSGCQTAAARHGLAQTKGHCIPQPASRGASGARRCMIWTTSGTGITRRCEIKHIALGQ